jgi:hypothetical protein
MSQTGPTFAEFYRAYLAHHRHPLNRGLHLLAKLLAVAALLAAVGEKSVVLLFAAPVLAVAPCWLGHLCFERNRPVSWERPTASLLGTLAGWITRRPSRRQADAGPAPAPAGRPYYSLLADLKMSGEMLVSRRAVAASPDTNPRT